MIPQFLIPHYKGNVERRQYLDAQFSQNKLPAPVFITEFDREEISASGFYAFDEKTCRDLIAPIADILVGHFIGLANMPNASWSDCFKAFNQLNLTVDQALIIFPG